MNTPRQVNEELAKLRQQVPMVDAICRDYEPKRYLDEQGRFWSPQISTYTLLNSMPAYNNWTQDTAFPWALSLQTRAIQYGVPTYFVTKELASALLKTVPPLAMGIDKLKFPFPSIRIVLEKGAFVNTSGVEYLSFFVGMVGEYKDTIPQSIRQMFPNIPEQVMFSRPCFTMVGWDRELTGDIALSYIHIPMGSNVQLIGDLLPRKDIHASFTNILNNDAKPLTIVEESELNSMAPFLINLLMLLTAKPEYVSNGGLVRKGKIKGKHKLDDLWSPHIVGNGYKLKHTTSEPTHTGKQMPSQWRAGHWKEQAYGPKYTLRKDLWIEPYGTGEYRA